MSTSHRQVARGGAVLALSLFVAVLAGCAPPPGPHKSNTSPLPDHSVSPAGSVTVGCDLARPVGSDTPPPGSDDLVFGPLVLRGLAGGYISDPVPQPDSDGVTFFKIGAEMAPGATATVTIDRDARGYAGILTEKGPSVGYSSVTYASCSPAVQPQDMFWVGGFTLVGRTSACVPLTVRVSGEATPYHHILPIESTSCPGTEGADS